MLWSQSCTTNSLTWRDVCWKSLGCYFIMSVLFGGTADHSKLIKSIYFGKVQVLLMFLKNMIKLMSTVLRNQIDLSFSTLFLGIIPDCLCIQDVYRFRIIAAAYKKAITKCWLKQAPPSMALLIRIVKHIHLMEMMSFSLHLQQHKWTGYWRKWNCFITSVDNKRYDLDSM